VPGEYATRNQPRNQEYALKNNIHRLSHAVDQSTGSGHLFSTVPHTQPRLACDALRVSSDLFVFVAQHRAPAEADLQSAVSDLTGIYIDVNVPPQDLRTHETTLAYVARSIGAFRIDTITYRGGDDDQRVVADVLEQWYANVPALANPDTDGIFPIPELIALMRITPYATFAPYADPSKRRG
jgi:hypothetical protein